ncbi:MAG TPA: cytochrome c [Vicinamibacterales bacterium]|nr:cytochrome c [Vicinamibacterales bacterium]
MIGRRSGAAAAALLTALVAVVAARGDEPKAPAAAAPTFASDVAPIVFANCVVCHRPGQAAPFPLLSYEDVRKHGQTIVDVVTRRYMPPWHASRAEGFPEFRDERRLTDKEIATLTAWVAADMPSGDLKKTPPPPIFQSGWSLGLPDLVLGLPKPIPVPADGPDQYRNVVVPLDLPEDRWITAIDFEPSARRVLHHALFFGGPADAQVSDSDALPGLGGGVLRGLAASGQRAGSGARLGAADDSWGGLGGWVPGVTPRFFPDGIAQPLPKHSNLVVQMHLHPSGKPEVEDGRLALYFAKKPPEKALTGIQVPPLFGFAVGITIPAGEANYTIHDAFELPVPVEAYGARGHAHYLCREMKMTATLPDGSTRGLLWIKDWDFSWQDSYFYKAPIRLPQGTRVEVTITYDNSDKNPRNPNSPPQLARWGRESFDEMGSMTLLVAAPKGADKDALRAAEAQHFRQQLLERMKKGGR